MANRTVTGPRGTYELMVTKALETPKWKRNATFGSGPEFGAPEYGESTRVDDQIRERNAERTSFSLALTNYVKDCFGTMWTNRNATGVRIRAVNWDPPVESLVWTTTKEAADRVLEEIAEGLEQGKVVQPAGAVFSGDENSN